jgi:alpha-aminoadipate carrier protein LysW
VEEIMVLCPECESDLDVEEDELDEGEILSCTECGSDFEVVGVEPLELTKVSDEDGEVEEVDPKELDEDADF